MTERPPIPPEHAERLICDTAARVALDLEPLIGRTVEGLRESEHWNAMIASEEIAADVLDDVWFDEALAEAYARGLADVHEQCLAQAMRVLDSIELLEAEGSESWIARAISHQLATHVAWAALDRLDLLSQLPLDAYCAGCGLELNGDDTVEPE